MHWSSHFPVREHLSRVGRGMGSLPAAAPATSTATTRPQRSPSAPALRWVVTVAATIASTWRSTWWPRRRASPLSRLRPRRCVAGSCSASSPARTCSGWPDYDQLAANWRLLEETGTSTNALSKLLFDVARRPIRQPARRAGGIGDPLRRHGARQGGAVLRRSVRGGAAQRRDRRDRRARVPRRRQHRRGNLRVRPRPADPIVPRRTVPAHRSTTSGRRARAVLCLLRDRLGANSTCTTTTATWSPTSRRRSPSSSRRSARPNPASPCCCSGWDRPCTTCSSPPRRRRRCPRRVPADEPAGDRAMVDRGERRP